MPNEGRFFIIGPGRSGTSMFQDEINSHPEIRCFLEPFHRLEADPRQNPIFADEPLFDEFLGEQGLDQSTASYGKFLGGLAEKADKPVWGFKLIGTHVQERPGLLDVLREEGFNALLVTRRNEVQAAMSLLIAAGRGVYNTRAQAPTGKVEIDYQELLRTVLAARKAKEAVAGIVSRLGFPVLEMVYEDRLERGLLYNQKTFKFLGVDPLAPCRKSTFTRMAPAEDYPAIIANYSQVMAALKMAKLDHLLAAR